MENLQDIPDEKRIQSIISFSYSREIDIDCKNMKAGHRRKNHSSQNSTSEGRASQLFLQHIDSINFKF